MTGFLVVVLVLIVAVLGIALGYLLARSKSTAELAAARAELQGVELSKAAIEGRLTSTQQQVDALRLQQQSDADTTARLGTLHKQLDSLQQQVVEAEKGRAAAHAQVKAQLQSQGELTRTATDEVQREARKLSKALSRTNVRGLWGESELRRLVETAGMLERVHFESQATIAGVDASKRPDMIVHLAGSRDIVVDAKVPLDALLEDHGDESDTYSAAVLQRHAAALKSHIDTLAARRYSELLADSPELVVLYLPAESLLSLALSADAGLLDHAFGKGVALATPTTMLALLRTVNHGWRQEAVAQNAREIHALGAELHKRLATMSGHFREVGKSLDAAVRAYNKTVASYESRVLVQARRFSELNLVTDEIPTTAPVERVAQPPALAEVDVSDSTVLRAIGGSEATG